MAVQHWRSYLQHGEFLIFTDQKSLTQLSKQRIHTHWQQKVFTKLLGLQCRIIYKKGSDNRVADALSRKTVHSSFCAALSTVTPKWIQEILAGYQLDADSLENIAKLSIDPAVVPNYTLVDGLLRYKQRIWIGSNVALQHKLLTACHASALGAIPGCQ